MNEYEKKATSACLSGLKPGIKGGADTPSLKAGVNERQFVDDAVALCPVRLRPLPSL